MSISLAKVYFIRNANLKLTFCILQTTSSHAFAIVILGMLVGRLNPEALTQKVPPELVCRVPWQHPVLPVESNKPPATLVPQFP